MVTRWLAGLCLLAAAGLPAFCVAGCQGLPTISALTAEPPPEWLQAEYQVHPNDQLEIAVWGQQDLSRTVRVRQDGTFPFPFLQEVLARGYTLQDLEQVLAQGLAAGYLHEPLVTAKLIGPRFSMLGEVERPGTYALEGRVDLLAALSMAGGLSKFGAPKVELIRVLADGQKLSHTLDINAILSGRHPTVLLHPHDTVVVKRRIF